MSGQASNRVFGCTAETFDGVLLQTVFVGYVGLHIF